MEGAVATASGRGAWQRSLGDILRNATSERALPTCIHFPQASPHLTYLPPDSLLGFSPLPLAWLSGFAASVVRWAVLEACFCSGRCPLGPIRTWQAAGS